MRKTLLLLMVLALVMCTLAYAAPYAAQSYTGQRSYYSQQNYNQNWAGYGYNYQSPSRFGVGNNAYYVIDRHPGYNGNGPFLYPSRSYNPATGGYKTTYSSHFYIDSAIDQAYARNPSMLEPRRMMNTQRRHSMHYW